MKDEGFNEIAKRIFERASRLLIPKGKDYGDEDRLRNFKNVAAAWSILTGKSMTPVEAALFLELLKLDRYMNLYAKRVAAKNESVEDTTVDGINYWALMEACRRDE